VKLIGAHSDFDSTPCSRKGISKRQTAAYGLSIRSYRCSRSCHTFFLDRMYHLGHHLWAQYVASTTICSRACLRECVSGFLGSTSLARQNCHAKNADSITALPFCLRVRRSASSVHKYGGPYDDSSSSVNTAKNRRQQHEKLSSS
jgi:hypothetical protein